MKMKEMMINHLKREKEMKLKKMRQELIMNQDQQTNDYDLDDANYINCIISKIFNIKSIQ
jgi:hypothetical protein